VSVESMPLRTFLRVRRARSVLSVTIVCGALTAWLGTYHATLPSLADHGRAIIPLWRLLAMGAAITPVMSLHSQLADLEVVSTRHLRSFEHRYLAGANLGSAAIYFGMSALTLPPSVLMIMARSWLAWCGLALLAGALIGWRLAWTLPVIIAIVLWYWGFQGSDQYRWWEFSARPFSDMLSVLLSAAVLTLGVAGYWLTPWRRHWLLSAGMRSARRGAGRHR
jgi:hypothetical protein